MKQFKLPRMDSNEINELIESNGICRIAFMGDEYPYIAPFQYVKYDDHLYFHFTDYGRKMRLIEKNNRVCVSVEKLNEDMSDFKFVVLNGRLEKVDNLNERFQVIKKLIEEGSQNFSTNFIVVHGLDSKTSWSSLGNDQDMIIFKLLKDEELGLKSP